MTDKNKPRKDGKEDASLKSETQYCEECGGTLKPGKIKLEEFEGGKLYVIEDVPVMECESCGEVWVPEPIIKEFEQMMDTAKNKPTKKLKKKGDS
jgi:YgiT-type zinc finger domain-containing protein